MRAHGVGSEGLEGGGQCLRAHGVGGEGLAQQPVDLLQLLLKRGLVSNHTSKQAHSLVVLHARCALASTTGSKRANDRWQLVYMYNIIYG